MIINNLTSEFENFLINKINEKNIQSNNLKKAMLYSVERGGKRLRPGLILLTAQAFNFDVKELYNYAAALEMVHEFSLVHDDLPSMDNDDLRRNKPTTHIVYGEADALLAGDALLNLAFEISLNDMNNNFSKNKLKAYEFMFKKSGSEGMIDGQSFEMIANNDVNDYIKTIENKTCALFQIAIYGSGLYLGLDDRYLNILDKLSYYIGIGFQVVDDKSDNDGIYNISKKHGDDIILECKNNIDSIYDKLLDCNININGYKELTDTLFSRDFINI